MHVLDLLELETAMSPQTVATPKRMLGLYDRPFWDSVSGHAMKLQCCAECSAWRYPPGPICAECLSIDHEWFPVSGDAVVMSWIVFRRAYFPAYPPPTNVIAVRLAEGPVMVSNLVGEEPRGNWIGCRLKLTYSQMPDGVVLPRFRIAGAALERGIS
jgi:uncharacterized OB-fold protein